MKLKKGDSVKVLRGKDLGKTGKIEKVFSKVNKVLVAGINQYKRHLKARSQRQPSEIVTITKPIPAGNVVVICPKCQLATRIGFLYEDDKKTRICKKCKQKL
jgi:large subunit ribosomal protein L24